MAVGLQLAGKNDFVRVQEDINDNLIKLDEVIDFNLLATLGIEYGGILNNTNAKVAGKAYYDTTGKKLYKCIVNTSINYADARYFEAISNNDLLDYATTTHKLIDEANFKIFKKNGVVSVYYAGPHNGSPSNHIYTLPVGYRPIVTQRVAIFPNSNSNTNVIVYESGELALDSFSGGPTSVLFGISFPCAD